MTVDISAVPEDVATVVKRMLIQESRLSIDPGELALDEPLHGSTLKVSSFGFVGMLVNLEDELGVDLPDDLFVGKSFTTVEDVVSVVGTAVAGEG